MDVNIIDAMTGEWQNPKQSTDMKGKFGQYYSTHNHVGYKGIILGSIMHNA